MYHGPCRCTTGPGGEEGGCGRRSREPLTASHAYLMGGKTGDKHKCWLTHTHTQLRRPNWGCIQKGHCQNSDSENGVVETHVCGQHAFGM